MPNPILTQVQVASVTYDIHDARITGDVLQFAGVNTEVSDKQPVTGDYIAGDVVINNVSGKEFVVVDLDTDQEAIDFTGDNSATAGLY